MKGKRGKILVVDDYTLHISLIRGCLEPEGFEIVTADNSYKVLDVILREKPALMFINLSLPGMESNKIMKLVCDDNKVKAMPILTINSQNSDLYDTRSGHNVIDNIFIPVKKKNLISKVNDILIKNDIMGMKHNQV